MFCKNSSMIHIFCIIFNLNINFDILYMIIFMYQLYVLFTLTCLCTRFGNTFLEILQ